MAKADIWRGTAAVFLAVSLALAFSPGVTSAQTPVSGFSGLNGANSKKPIDIESDRLDVDDKKHVAIFTGSVSATQGDYNLTAPRLEVFYVNGGAQGPQAQGQPAKPPVKKVSQDSSASDPISSGQIDHIHAFGGPVVMKNPKDEQQATGDDAYYDVKSQKITMIGSKVVLTQKKNVIEGRKLLVDLNTGQATVIPDEEAHAKGSTPPPKGRVRAILQQEGAAALTGASLAGAQKKNGEAVKPAQTAPKQAQQSGGWQPQGQ